MARAAHAACVTFALVGFACAPSNDALRAQLERRAKADTRCAEVALVPAGDLNGYVTAYDAAACGHRLTYVLSSATLAWRLASEDGRPSAPALEPEPPEPVPIDPLPAPSPVPPAAPLPIPPLP
jgi:hypothetical protein